MYQTALSDLGRTPLSKWKRAPRRRVGAFMATRTAQDLSTSKKEGRASERGLDLSLQTKVIDTNVLLSDPNAILAFEDANVVICTTVQNELAAKKKDPEIGHVARAAIRLIRDLLIESGTPSGQPVFLDNGSTLRLVPNGIKTEELIKAGYDPKENDTRIVGACVGLRELGENVVLVTGDADMQIKAYAVGIPTEEFLTNLPAEHAGPGWQEILTNDPGDVDNAHRLKYMDLDHPAVQDAGIEPNEGVLLKVDGTSQSVLMRRKGDKLIKIEDRNIYLDNGKRHHFKPRSLEQKVALELLLDPDIELVALSGLAGSGKTLMALAAGLHQLVHPDRSYTNITVYRPTVSVSKQADLGFLPGDLNEKIAPWMTALQDGFEALMGKDGDPLRAEAWMESLKNQGQLRYISMQHLRGRTLTNSFVISDESQNGQLHEIVTLLTRAGQGTKIVLTGDPSQIDLSFLSATNNGLSSAIESFRREEIFGHVILTRGERSKLSELSAKLML